MSGDICGCHSWGALLVWSGWRPGMLSTLQRPGQLHPRERSGPDWRPECRQGETLVRIPASRCRKSNLISECCPSLPSDLEYMALGPYYPSTMGGILNGKTSPAPRVFGQQNMACNNSYLLKTFWWYSGYKMFCLHSSLNS